MAADESHRQGEDGPRCPRRWGVLVRQFLLLPFWSARTTSECLLPSGWTSRISVTISRMWWCAGLWRGFCCGPDLTGGRSTSTGSGLQLRHLMLLRRGTAWRPELRREEEVVKGTARPRRREDGRQRWIRGADVEVASTTRTHSCTILR